MLRKLPVLFLLTLNPMVALGQAEAPREREPVTVASGPSAVDSPAGEGCCNYLPGAAGISADFLLETCAVTGQTARGMIPWFDCQSYVLAVLDSYQALHGALPAAQRFCAPRDLSARSVLDAVAAGFEHDRDASRRAAEVILEALRKRYPCPR